MTEQKRWENRQSYHLLAAEAASQVEKAIQTNKPTKDYIFAEQEYNKCVDQIERLSETTVNEEEFASHK